ncbi:MAG TPA: GNAT family N-acetyltransferase [Polyangiaceae bacterium]|nr:GNAT family N-acetyltransferase [Polyangiaceae bacterium]
MLGQLRSSRLVLRDATPEDAQHFFQLDQDPQVMRFLGGVNSNDSVERVRGMLAERVQWYTQTPGLGLGACFLLASAEFIGWFMLRPRTYHPYAAAALLEPREDAELGYRLARRFWAQGYATEMSQALVHHGLQQLALPRIVAFVDAEHHASVRVLEKAGLSHAGRARYEGEDVELYRIDARR